MSRENRHMNIFKNHETVNKNALLFLMIIFSFNIYSESDDGHWTDKVESPVVIIDGSVTSQDGVIKEVELALTSTIVDTKIIGVIADITITQTYQNNGSEDINASYIFPGSSRSAVYAMSMKIGDRIIKAKIKEKEQAKKEFEKAKAEGKKASLMEQQRPNVFQMNLANIPAGDKMIITISYTELLIPEEGIYEFIFPTVVGPRYDSQENTQKEPWWVIKSNEKLEKQMKNRSTRISVEIDAPLPLSKIECVSHKVKIQKDGNTAQLNYSIKSVEDLKDFILSFSLKGNETQSGISTFKGKDENFFLFMMESPDRDKILMVPPREYIFIVDVSGSMNGFPMDVTKELMRNLMKGLHVQDRFNVLLFAGDSRFLSEESLPATTANLKKAIEVIDNQSGNGSTQLLPAMEKALEFPKKEGYSRNFIIVTDGFVSVEKRTYDLIKENLGEANFFSFGIGESVNRYIMEGIAHVGQGEAFIATTKQEAKEKAKKFLKYIDQPTLTDIKVDFDNWDVYDVIPKYHPDLFSSKPLVIFGKYKSAPTGKVKIMAKLGIEKFEQEIDIAESSDNDNREALKYLWARRKIQGLSDYAKVSHNSDLEKEITQLGLDYNLLTDYTSFIAIDENENQANLPEKTNIINSGNGGSVPEPHEWAMIILVLLTILFTTMKRFA